MTATETTTTVVVPGTHLMSALVGPRDQHLRQIEEAFPRTEINVRGNEITVRGEQVGPGRAAVRGGRRAAAARPRPRRGEPAAGHRHGRRRRAPERDPHPGRPARRPGRQVRPKSAGQKRYIDTIAENVITFGIGPAGTGKSWLAVAMAVKALQAKEVQRIILTRPAVEAGERLGFLPGDLMAKIDPYLRPLYDALYDMVEPEGAQRLLERQTVEVAPLAFMRGRTLNNSFIILDEAQNTTPEQMKMFLTRIGFGSASSSPATSPRSTCPTARAACSASSGCSPASTGSPSCTSRRPTSCATASSPTSSPRTSAATTPAVMTSGEPPSPTGAAAVEVVGADEQDEVPVDVERWSDARPARVLTDEERHGELTLTFVDRDEITALNREHLGQRGGPTDVLVLPLDADAEALERRCAGRMLASERRDPGARLAGVPVLLGDVVVCPAVAAEQAPAHAGTLDDELALLVVHGVLHVIGHDHAAPEEAAPMRARELEHLAAPPLARTGTRRVPAGA